MINKQNPKKTLEVLSDYSKYFQPGLFSEGLPTIIIYGTFERWVIAFKDEAFVNDYKQVTNVCALNLVDPSTNPSPNLDYSAELPASMSPRKLIMVYGRLWELQTQAGL